jgi:hypothetical protein
MSWIEVVLDTQVNLGVEFEAGPEPNTIIVKLASDEDVVDVKLWGAIDVTDPANANYAEDQGSAEWFSFASELIVKVAPGEGQKVFRVQVRDDVWNESEVATIKFGVAPEEEVEVAPRTPGWPVPAPSKRSRKSSRRIEYTSRVGVQIRTEVERANGRQVAPVTRVGVQTTTTIERSRVLVLRSSVGVAVRTSTAATLDREALIGVAIDTEIIRRRGRADDDAIVALLL